MSKLLLLLMRKPGENRINIALRILASALSLVLFFLVTYYFLSVNRTQPLLDQLDRRIVNASKAENYKPENHKSDITLMGRIKAVLSQSKRLHGYSIGVECKDGKVTINGEVPTQIDKDLAEQLVSQTPGVNETINNLIILPAAPRMDQEAFPSALPVKVEDFELQANLLEKISATAELGKSKISIKVKNKIVTLQGSVANEQTKAQIEKIIGNFPQVSQVNNQLKVLSRTEQK
jgi:osmotically-inducible protein OsmY